MKDIGKKCVHDRNKSKFEYMLISKKLHLKEICVKKISCKQVLSQKIVFVIKQRPGST